MPTAEAGAKLLNFFFPSDVAFGRVYAITAPFILELKRTAPFFINDGTVATYHDREPVAESSFFK